MGLVFKQQAGTAGSASSTCNAGGHDVGSNAKSWDAQVDGGTAGTQYTLTVPGTDTGEDSVVLLAQWESSGPEYGNPGATVTWEAGNWICRVNVSQANRNVYWDAVEICALEGGSTTAIASASGLDTNLSSTGTYSTTITTGSPATVPLGSTIIWSFFFGQDIGTSGGQSFKVRSNKNLATPIANKAAVPVADVAPAAVVPGTTFGAISVATPTATFASASLAPGTTFGTASVAAPTATSATSPLVPGATFGTASVAAPAATFASAALVPGATMGTASVSAPVAAFAASSLAPSATFGTASVAAPAATFASGAVVPGTTFGAISASVPSVSVTSASLAPGVTHSAISAAVPSVSVASASLAPGVTHSAISAAVPSVSVASANTPPRYKIDSSARPSFRAYMSINRMEASDAATSEFARSMLDSCGTEAWRFGFAMSGRYRIHSMNVTAQAIAAAASGRATLADAGFDAGALMQAGASRGVQQAECVQAGSSSAGTVQRAHIESGERAA